MSHPLKELTKSMTYEESLQAINDYIVAHPDDDEAYTLRGMRHWGAGHRGAAINDYLTAVRINPQSRAAQALKAANEILDYRNNDMFNP